MPSDAPKRSEEAENAWQLGLSVGMRRGLIAAERICRDEIERLWNANNVDAARPGSKHHMKGGHLAALGCAGAIKKLRLALEAARDA